MNLDEQQDVVSVFALVIGMGALVLLVHLVGEYFGWLMILIIAGRLLTLLVNRFGGSQVAPIQAETQDETKATALASPEPQTQPNAPAGAQEGIMTMRALGYPLTIFAALAWLLMAACCAVIFLFPAARAAGMPLFGGTVFDFFRGFGQFALVGLIVLNGLSGRWGPENLRSLDLWSTRFGFWFLAGVGVALASFSDLRTGLERPDYWFLGAVLGFGLYDLLVNRGEDWRSSLLKTVRAAQPAAASALGPFHSFVAVLGAGARIQIPDTYPAYIVLRGDGYVLTDTDLGEAQVFAILGAAVTQRSRPAAA